MTPLPRWWSWTPNNFWCDFPWARPRNAQTGGQPSDPPETRPKTEERQRTTPHLQKREMDPWGCTHRAKRAGVVGARSSRSPEQWSCKHQLTSIGWVPPGSRIPPPFRPNMHQPVVHTMKLVRAREASRLALNDRDSEDFGHLPSCQDFAESVEAPALDGNRPTS